ncbi:hypothetical protein CPC08DRAFT_751553 [Agrocybe pediades]|nr:hypothetical protein CPC08DRAFT_751553 [Agrocybe pediades]
MQVQSAQDPTKKTSITSLLNPQEVSRYPAQSSDPLVVNQSHNTVIYGTSHYDPAGSYQLRGASWDSVDDPSRRHHHPQSPIDQRHYQRHSPSAEYAYPDGAQEYSGHSSWQPPPAGSHHDMTYNHEQPVWQAGSRASVRIVAKDSAAQQHGYGQQPHPYYNRHHQMYSQSYDLYGRAHDQPLASSTSPPQEQSTSASSSSKRQLSADDTALAPKAKRPKTKSKTSATDTTSPSSTTPGATKRGYSAKKRNEAAQISAQNDALQKSMSTNAQDTLVDQEGVSVIIELQGARCMSNRYKNEIFPRCVSCTRRWAGDTCRFQGIRYFLRDPQKRLFSMTFRAAQPPTPPIMHFPKQWNRSLEKGHINRTKLSIAKSLLPTLMKEQEHVQTDDIVRRARETDVRATCDTCMTSLFASTFMCRLCGREVCNDCFKQVRELTEEPENASPAERAAIAQRREVFSRSNPFFLHCARRNEHMASNFTPVTRFLSNELDEAVQAMTTFLASDVREEAERASEALTETLQKPSIVQDLGLKLYPPVSPGNKQTHFPDPLQQPIYDNYVPAREPQHITEIPIYRAQIIPASYYDPPSVSSGSSTFPAFSSLWRQGLPLLVKDVLPRFKLEWTPKSFVQRYGEQGCLVVECQTDTNQRITIENFFNSFGKYEGRNECLKLKDWPTNTDFKTACPDLYEDFSNAVPVPDYVRRDGVYNIGSHFPTNAVGPDLGPKMYNSFASSQEPGSRGSTRLHMDMADALNVMLHAEPCPDGSEGYAVWDLYRAEDSDTIRAFLKKRFGYNPAANNVNGSNAGASSSKSASDKGSAQGAPPVQMLGHDGIHNQQFYLDVELRKALWEECGVKSYRIYQRPGDGVFIPAGCAHQVANMSDCMKIATDFVSPENIDRCEKLTREFREQNHSKVWKEDVLQLRTMMWFAWQSCSAREEEIAKEDGATNHGRVETGHDRIMAEVLPAVGARVNEDRQSRGL